MECQAQVVGVKSFDYPDVAWFLTTLISQSQHTLRARDPSIIITHIIPHFLPSHSVSQWLSSPNLLGGMTTLPECARCSSSISGEAVTSLDLACSFSGRVHCSSSVSVTGVVTFSDMASGLVFLLLLLSTCPGPCATRVPVRSQVTPPLTLCLASHGCDLHYSRLIGSLSPHLVLAHGHRHLFLLCRHCTINCLWIL